MFISEKEELQAVVSAVMGHKRNDRKMVLAEWKTRCIKEGEIHEFLSSTDFGGDKTKTLNNFVYLGFFRFTKGGVIEIGDRLITGKNTVLGEIIGFDDTHLPNHINIVLSGQDKTGEELGLKAGQQIIIKRKEQ